MTTQHNVQKISMYNQFFLSVIHDLYLNLGKILFSLRSKNITVGPTYMCKMQTLFITVFTGVCVRYWSWLSKTMA